MIQVGRERQLPVHLAMSQRLFLLFVKQIAIDLPLYFILQHSTGSGGGGQQLMSAGSCLERFQAHPFIKCGSHGTCQYLASKFSFWLVASRSLDWSPHSPTQTLKGDSWLEKISRCSVCQQDTLMKGL